MKEFSHPLDLFSQGLRTNNVRQLNRPGLTECVGFRMIPEGLEPMPSLTNPFTALEAELDWPFPQLFRFNNTTYLLTRHYIYSVNTDWSLTVRAAWFNSGGIWDGLDFGNFVVFVNGSVNVLNDTGTSTFHFAPTTEFPACQTACNYKGQIIIGNTATASNCVEWSEIGANLWTINRSNEAGRRVMPWDGDVLRVKVLDKHVVVYGDSGITLMSPVIEPVVSFGFDDLAYYGIAGRGAVGGSSKEHLFIDEAGYLRRLTKGGIERLGYQEFFQPMLGTEIQIVYNELEEEYYISNSVVSYVLTKNGLTETDEYVSSGALFDGSFVAIKGSHSKSYRTVVSNPFDFGHRAGKTITQVAVQSTQNENLEVAFDWRNSTNNSFTRTDYRKVNELGFAEGPVDATEFRLAFRVPFASTIELGGEVLLNYKSSDKRNIRGAYAPGKN